MNERGRARLSLHPNTSAAAGFPNVLRLHKRTAIHWHRTLVIPVDNFGVVVDVNKTQMLKRRPVPLPNFALSMVLVEENNRFQGDVLPRLDLLLVGIRIELVLQLDIKHVRPLSPERLEVLVAGAP